MKKAIKKATVLVSLVSMMTLSLAGCAKTTKCEMCEETKKCNKYEMTFEGESESAYLCETCSGTMESLIKLAGGTMKKK